MKIFLKINYRILSFCFVLLVLFSFENFCNDTSLESKLPTNLTSMVSNRDGIGFLVLNAPVNNTWALLCPLTELLADSNIKAVVLYGMKNVNGATAWSYLSCLQELKRAYNKPIIAYTDSALSGVASYIMSCGADAIVVAPWSIVDGIEYSTSSMFYHDKDKKEGKVLNFIYSGKFKDENVHIAPKSEHIKRVEVFVDLAFGALCKDIIARRPNAGIYKDKWVKGNSLNAHEALTYGLIDGISDKTDLVGYALNYAGLPNRNVSNVNVAVKEPLEDSSFEHKTNNQKPTIGILKIHKLSELCWDYTQTLLSLFQDETIDKIILDIRLADERYVKASSLYYDILKLKQIYKKPVIAYVEQALSGGYYIASAADYIIASPGAAIGSIGTSFSRWDLTQKMKNDHIKYLLVSTSKLASLFNEKVPLDAAGKEIIQKQLKFDHAKFVQDIKVCRPGLKSTDDFKWAEGQIFIAQDALKLGLIDAIGDPLDALNFGNSVINNKVHELNFVFKTIN